MWSRLSTSAPFAPGPKPVSGAQAVIPIAGLQLELPMADIYAGTERPADAEIPLVRKNSPPVKPNSLVASLAASLPRDTGNFASSHCCSSIKMDANRLIVGRFLN
jgi:hypothetical protein